MTDHTVKKNPASIPHSIWHADDLRRAEKEAADSLGITLYELMQRAGEAAFNIARSAYPQSGHWLILCGHGNNGGDGYVVARLAVAAGLRVTLLALESDKPLPEEASAAREAWLNAGGVIHASDIVWPEDVDLIIDGLLGTGLRSAPRDNVAALIARQCPYRADGGAGYSLWSVGGNRCDARCGDPGRAYRHVYCPEARVTHRESEGCGGLVAP